VSAGRRLVALGIVPAEHVGEMWARGAWVLDERWRLALPGADQLGGDDAASIASLLAGVARRRGEPRRLVELCRFRGILPETVARTEKDTAFRKLPRTPAHQFDCDCMVTQLWCDIDSAVDDLRRAPTSLERLSLAHTAVYNLMSQGMLGDYKKIMETMRSVYVPALIRDSPGLRRSIEVVFRPALLASKPIRS
jgi:hypothetical protein